MDFPSAGRRQPALIGCPPGDHSGGIFIYPQQVRDVAERDVEVNPPVGCRVHRFAQASSKGKGVVWLGHADTTPLRPKCCARRAKNPPFWGGRPFEIPPLRPTPIARLIPASPADGVAWASVAERHGCLLPLVGMERAMADRLDGLAQVFASAIEMRSEKKHAALRLAERSAAIEADARANDAVRRQIQASRDLLAKPLKVPKG